MILIHVKKYKRALSRHVIIYQAMDAAGNRERCVFSIR